MVLYVFLTLRKIEMIKMFLMAFMFPIKIVLVREKEVDQFILVKNTKTTQFMVLFQFQSCILMPMLLIKEKDTVIHQQIKTMPKEYLWEMTQK